MVTLQTTEGDGLLNVANAGNVTVGLEDSLHELGLSVRVINALENPEEEPNAYGHVHQVRTVRELLSLRPEDILAIANLGDKTLQEIRACLAKCGYCRSGEEPPPLSSQERRQLVQRNRLVELRRSLAYRC